MVLFNPCMKFGPNTFICSAWKVPFNDFIKNKFQAPSKCLSKWIKMDKWDYLKNPSQELQNSFCLLRVPMNP